MVFYARRRWRMAGQLVTDVLVAAWVVVWGLLGRLTHATVLDVARPARESADAAARLSTELRQVAAGAGSLPGVGPRLRQPLDAASGSLTDLLGAADRQVAGIERLAELLGWLVFAIPVAVVLFRWLPGRIAFVVRARAAQRYLDSGADLELFALRALANQPLRVLGRISDDPVGAWRAGDATVIHNLADVELRRSGLRMPTSEPAAEI